MSVPRPGSWRGGAGASPRILARGRARPRRSRGIAGRSPRREAGAALYGRHRRSALPALCARRGGSPGPCLRGAPAAGSICRSQSRGHSGRPAKRLFSAIIARQARAASPPLLRSSTFARAQAWSQFSQVRMPYPSAAPRSHARSCSFRALSLSVQTARSWRRDRRVSTELLSYGILRRHNPSARPSRPLGLAC